MSRTPRVISSLDQDNAVGLRNLRAWAQDEGAALIDEVASPLDSQSTFADGEVTLEREVPFFWREYRRKDWRRTRDGLLVCPDLLPFVDHPDLEEK